MQSPRYHPILTEEILLQMDWQTEQGEITRLTANSHLVVVSRHAITEQDQ
jgi:hypothetical protein